MTREELETRASARIELDRRRSIPRSSDPAEMARACRHWINAFCYTFNPKLPPYHFRFLLFPFQEEMVLEIVEAIEGGYDLFYDKCREMGATYTVIVVFLWYWQFVPGSNFLLGSRKEDLVDNTKAGSEDANKEESLFGKIEYVLGRVWEQALPLGFDRARHLTYMSLVNPELGNVISGESANPNFSRGGRQKAILMDEFAFWDNDAAAWGATADTTNCRIPVTTPGIRPSKAKRLRFGEDGEKIRVRTLTWELNPYHTPEWLEAQRERRSREDFAREITVDWQGSLTGVVYPEIAYAEKGDYPYDPRWPLYCGWDFGLDGVAVIWCQPNPNSGRLRVVDYYENADKVIQFYFPFLGRPIDEAFARQYAVQDIRAIRELKPLKGPIHFGDPDVAKRSLVAETSTEKELRKAGIEVLSNRTANDFGSRREQAKVVLQKGIEVNDNERTRRWVLCMENARYPQRPENSQATTEVSLPVHDWTSHGRTAFEYFCVNWRLGSGGSGAGGVISQKKEGSKWAVSRTYAEKGGGDRVLEDVLEGMREAEDLSNPYR